MLDALLYMLVCLYMQSRVVRPCGAARWLALFLFANVAHALRAAQRIRHV